VIFRFAITVDEAAVGRVRKSGKERDKTCDVQTERTTDQVGPRRREEGRQAVVFNL
jgi:hypothetical protein